MILATDADDVMDLRAAADACYRKWLEEYWITDGNLGREIKEALHSVMSEDCVN